MDAIDIVERRGGRGCTPPADRADGSNLLAAGGSAGLKRKVSWYTFAAALNANLSDAPPNHDVRRCCAVLL
ncbi:MULTISPECIES: hypothetical protein [Sorangium]|uniref:hypothetical protein n=1 Tax=Sorangium TaxID=39643 RepID=UPI00101A4C13|nr:MULTISPECIES: hypothetical protein [Sorangium]